MTQVPAVELVTMGGGEDLLLRPVLRGMCKYESLLDGTLTLVDVALMNEAMNVDDENRARITKEVMRGR